MVTTAPDNRIARCALGSALTILCAATAARAAATVYPAEGAPFEASLVGIADDGQVTLQTDQGPRSLTWADIVRWGHFVEPRGGIHLLPATGGVIVAATAETTDEQLRFVSDLLGDRAIPLEFLAGILLQPPRDLQDRDRLTNRALERSAQSDRLLLENGDELPGTFTSLNAASLTFDSQGQKLVTETARIAAVAFDPSLAATKKPTQMRLLVGLRDGSRLLADGLIATGEEAQLTVFGQEVWKIPLDAVVCLQPLGGKATYLSDVQPESYRHLPFLSESWPYHNDGNVQGTQLRAGGHPFAKGIGMHSAARLTYRLDKRFRRFAALAAIDDQVADRGSVVFGVYVDDRLAWKSDPVRGGMPPVPVDVDISGATRLSLIVEFGERGDELDRADWLDARILE